jgi:hypothetical protein
VSLQLRNQTLEDPARTPVTNVRSNAMARTMGFVPLWSSAFTFRDRVLRRNHRRLDLLSR